MFEAYDIIDNRKLVRIMTEKRVKTNLLSRKTGLTEVTISGLRTGKRNTCLKTTTFRIADALNIKPEDITADREDLLA